MTDNIHELARMLYVEREISKKSEEISRGLQNHLIKILDEKPDDVIREYKEKSFLIGKKLIIHPIIGDEKSEYEAKAIDIDKNASLIVELADGSKRILSSGEVSLHSDSWFLFSRGDRSLNFSGAWGQISKCSGDRPLTFKPICMGTDP